MAQTPQKWGPEPWLKPPKKVLPSHGSNSQKRHSRAMAQTQLCTAHFHMQKLQQKHHQNFIQDNAQHEQLHL